MIFSIFECPVLRNKKLRTCPRQGDIFSISLIRLFYPKISGPALTLTSPNNNQGHLHSITWRVEQNLHLSSAPKFEIHWPISALFSQSHHRSLNPSCGLAHSINDIVGNRIGHSSAAVQQCSSAAVQLDKHCWCDDKSTDQIFAANTRRRRRRTFSSTDRRLVVASPTRRSTRSRRRSSTDTGWRTSTARHQLPTSVDTTPVKNSAIWRLLVWYVTGKV